MLVEQDIFAKIGKKSPEINRFCRVEGYKIPFITEPTQLFKPTRRSFSATELNNDERGTQKQKE